MKPIRIEDLNLEMEPLEVARLELTLKLMPDGRRAVGFLATDTDGETPNLFDLHGMLGFAQATINDPEWLAEAYDCGEED